MKPGLAVGIGTGAAAAALLYGDRRWRAATGAYLARLRQLRPAVPASSDHAELDPIPPPVQRYFRQVLGRGQRLITAATITQEGQFRMRETADGWRAMTATEYFYPPGPGFLWDARIRMLPGISVRVRDAYLEGAGLMQAELLALFPVLRAGSTPELVSGALQRYLAEAVWFPAALLPAQGIRWAPLGESAARATLSDRGNTVSLDFHFGPDDLIAGAFTSARYREVKGAYVPTAWECRYSDYAERDGMRIPLAGEVIWQLPDGPLPYWRGHLTKVRFTWAGAGT